MIILNEEKEAQKLLDDVNGYIKLGDLMLLAKYFESKGMNIYNNLTLYIRARTKEYNQVIYDTYIEKAIEHKNEYRLRSLNKIHITKKELDAILKIKDFKIQKVMFMMLIVSKYYKFNSNKVYDKKNTNKELYFKNSLSDLFKLAKVPYSLKENARITRELELMNYVEWYPSGSAKILIADLDGEPIEKLTPDDSMIYYLYQYQGYRVIKCDNCNKWERINKKANNVKYCKQCAPIIDKKKATERMRKIRQKEKK